MIKHEQVYKVNLSFLVLRSYILYFHDLTPNLYHISFSLEMVNLTTRLCWELVKKEGYIAIWQKPLNNSCYLSREAGTSPPLCDKDDDPDNVWYVMKKFPHGLDEFIAPSAYF